jgi:hypothetical protein
MFLRSVVGACIAGAALSIKLVNQTTAPLAEILSQTKASLTSEICLRTATANKADLPDFYDIYAGSELFTDDKFPHSSESFAWSDANEVYSSAAEAADTEWKRAKEAFPGKSLFGTNGITP